MSSTNYHHASISKYQKFVRRIGCNKNPRSPSSGPRLFALTIALSPFGLAGGVVDVLGGLVGSVAGERAGPAEFGNGALSVDLGGLLEGLSNVSILRGKHVLGMYLSRLN